MRYVFNRGYCDYNWWHRIDEAGSVFVTRFKRNAKLRVVARRPRPSGADEAILADEEVVLSNMNSEHCRERRWALAERQGALFS